jgi:hypothetical protein
MDEHAVPGRWQRLFSVRLWMEPSAAGEVLRGSVRDVSSGSYRGFSDWSTMTAFMLALIELDGAPAGEEEEALP